MTSPSAKSGAVGQTRTLLTLALPLIGSNLAQYMITMTDVLMVGWYDVVSLAGLTVAGSLYYIFFLVGTGIGWAVMPMVAAAAGTDDDTQVRRVTRMGVWQALIFGLLSLVPFLLAEPILLGLGQEVEVAQEGAHYLQIAGFGLAPALVIVVLRSYLSALELTRIVLIVTIASVVLNAVLNYALIFGNWGAPEMGVRGAAIASVVLQIFGLIWLALYAAKRTPQYQLFRNPQRPDWEAFVRVFRLAWPIGLTNFAEVGLFSASSIMMGWVGTVALAAHGIALQIASATFVVHLGLSQAVTVRVGRAFGRADWGEVWTMARISIGLSLLVALLTVVAFLTFPETLIGLFLSSDEPLRIEILTVGAILLAAAAVFQVVDGAQVVELGILRGIQDARIPMVIAAFAYWLIGIPASYLFGFTFDFGGVGIWAGLALGLALAALLLGIRFLRRLAEETA